MHFPSSRGIHPYSFMHMLHGRRYVPHVIKRTIQTKWLHYGCRAHIRETWIIHLSGVSCLITGDWTVASCSLQIGWKFSSMCFFRRILKRVRFHVLKPFYKATKHQCANIRKHRTTACKTGYTKDKTWKISINFLLLLFALLLRTQDGAVMTHSQTVMPLYVTANRSFSLNPSLS